MGCLVPLTLCWAASDVSLNAYVQSSLEQCEEHKSGISSLKAVISFLYCFQIVLFAVLGTLLGRMVDESVDLHDTFVWAAGVQFTIISVLSISASFIPKGSWALNPKVIGIGVDIQQEQDEGIQSSEKRDAETAGEADRRQNSGNVKRERQSVEDDRKRSMRSPVLLELDTIPRAMPTSV